MNYSTQQFVAIEDIKNDLILLKDGGVALVISTSAVNFGLLFEQEQIAIINSFAGLLNSLSFSIQIVIQSQRLDVSTYLKAIDQAAQKQTNTLLLQMIGSYRKFVEGLIKENDVLDKQFYVVITAGAFELGLLTKGSKDRIQKATTVLSPRKDHLIKQLARIGLKARQLTDPELVKMFYSAYNPPLDGKPLEQAASALPVASALKKEALPAPVNKTVRPLVRLTPPSPLSQIPARPNPYPHNVPGPLPQNVPQPLPAPVAPAPSVAQPTVARMSPPFIVEELNDDFGP